MDETDQYDEWDLSPPPMPPRSTLYALQPIGVRTPLVESLTSYITRLAEAHCVYSGMLMRKMVVPLVPNYSPLEKQHGLFTEAGYRSTLMNGGGLPALYATQALETLTLRSDLRFLTLLPLAKALPMRNCMRLTKAWCALCYEEWRANGRPLYDPLIWSFEEISICRRHHQPLSTQCPYPDCARSLPGVSWRSCIGYCSYCQRWLGKSPGQTQENASLPEGQDTLWQQWVIQTLSEMLAVVPSVLVLPERQRISQVLTWIVQQMSEDNIAAFSRLLGMSTSKVHFWCQGKRAPEMDVLLRLCHYLGLSLCEMLFQEVEHLQPTITGSFSLRSSVQRKKRVPPTDAIYQALEEILTRNEQPPPTLREVQRRLGGYHMTILRKIHPAACRKIVARHKAYIQHQKEDRLQRLQEEVRQVALQLRAEGIAPTQKRIALYLSQPGILRDPRIRVFLKEICQELTLEQ